MSKSFKKAIAILLAVLMVACSVPFTALAEIGGYTADVQLRFGTLFSDDALGATEDFYWNQDAAPLTGDTTFGTTSLVGPPVSWDQKNGTLTLKKEMTEAFDANMEMEGACVIAEDHQYGVGDLFTVTVELDGAQDLGAIILALEYSDTIEPFGQWTYKGGAAGTTAKYVWGSYSDGKAAYDADTSKKKKDFACNKFGVSALQDFSAYGLYPMVYNTDSSNGKVDDTSFIDPDQRIMDITVISADNATPTPVVDYDGILSDPETGEWGYTYTEDHIVLETFMFKVVKDGPITFDVWDKDGSKKTNFGGAAMTVLGDDTRPQNLTTYAINTFGNADGSENPGSCKMLFMGKNDNKSTPDPTPSNYTIKFVNAAGETVSEQTVEKDAMPTVPANTAADFDNEKHYSYAWPTVEAATADATYTEVKTGAVHTWGEEVVDKAATCATPGLSKTPCTACAYVLEEAIAIDPTAHDWELSAAKVDAGCTTEGKEAVYVCKNDASHTKGGETIEATGHTWVTKEVVAPTVKDAGYTLQECSECGETQKIDETAALGVKVTVEDADALGTVAGLAFGENKVAYGDTYTVTATPLDGAKFIGWAVNGKVVSSDATYTAVAYTDITVTPIFVEVGQDTITVIFYDKYANVLAQFTGTPAEVQAAIEAPQAPAYNGYTFTGWSIDESVFKAAETSMSIYAVYEENTAAAGYTVTTSATLELPEGIENGSIPYNTTAIVTAEGAQAWKVDGAIVGYGDTYEFFVGSNITVEPVYEAVATVEPTVTKISATQIEGSHKVSFLATRNVPDGFTLVSAGFVYGKALTDAELDLDNVNKTGASGGQIKVAYASVSGADQFALNYGLTSKQGTATAKAFIIVKKGDTVLAPIYSERFEFTY